MRKSKLNIKNILNYIIGNYRYRLYYFNTFLIRKHIKEQIDWRIKIMDIKCYKDGSCKLCGCATTALQMANKQCDKPCYPPMFSKRIWKKFLIGDEITINKDVWKYSYDYIDNKTLHYIFLNKKIISN